MIILDTNVISEPMRRDLDERVIAWLNRQLPPSLFAASVSVMALRFRIERLPEKQRKAVS